MSGFRPDITTHGNYRCPYCNHKVWKRNPAAAEKHIEENHHDEADRANDKLKIDKLEREKQTLEYKLKVYSQPPKQPEKKTEYYDAHVFCTNCGSLSKCGMPKGTPTGSVTCPVCGVCTLHLATNVSSFWSLK